MSVSRTFGDLVPTCLLIIIAFGASTARGAIFTEGWETPDLSPGGTSGLPVPWSVFPGSSGSAVVYYPTSSDFSQTAPLASPAGGNQALLLTGPNTGVDRLSGELIQANTTYTLSAAIGNDLQSVIRNDSWSLQLWADTNQDHIFNGFDTFIGQQFGTNVGAINAAAGQWATNSFSFDSATTPSLVGEELIVFLNNFDLANSASYYDNVTLTATPDQAVVPEPASMLLWLGAAAAICSPRLRRRKKENSKTRFGRIDNRRIMPRLERLEDRSLLTAGTLDPTFGSGGELTTDFNGLDDATSQVVVQSNGRIVVVGSATGGASGEDFAIARYMPDGSLDNSFGTNGRVTIDFGSDRDEASGVALQPDGKIVVAGTAGNRSDFDQFAVTRLNTDGTVDTTFGSAGKLRFSLGAGNPNLVGSESLCNAVTLQSDGKIVLAGQEIEFTNVTISSDLGLARLMPDGSFDASFGAGGKKIIDVSGGAFDGDGASAVAVQDDGKIAIAGNFNGFGAVRLNSDGSLDTGFGTGGKKILTGLARANSMVIQPDGKLVIAGDERDSWVNNNSAGVDMAVARLNPDGSLDNTFSGDGVQTVDFSSRFDFCNAVALQADGKMILTGYSMTFPVVESHSAVARLNSDGTIDSSFNGSGTELLTFGSTSEIGTGVAIQHNGRIVVAGYSRQLATGDDFSLARLAGDAAIVPNHAPVATDDQYSVEEDGVLSVAAPGLLANDTDADGDPLTVSLHSGPAHGVLSLNADGGFTYTPGIGSDATTDSFTYSVDDGNGGTAIATVTIAITQYSGVSVAGGILRASGGPGDDVITVNGDKLIVNGTPNSLAGVTEIRIWGRAGNDQVDLTGLSIPAFVDGGDGNDTLIGGSADDVIFGGAGDDAISGGAGNDFLIGGAGKDRIVGSAGNDILVSGDVDSTMSLAVLQAISQDWSATHTETDDDVGDMIDETLGDTNSDQLTGGSGTDLFIINTGDVITDFQFGKPKTNKDVDVVVVNGVVTA